MAVYAYLRVSTDEQDSNNQRLGVDALAQRLGVTIDEYITDEGVSGTREPEKRELGALLSRLNRSDILLAGEISRLGRNLFMVMRILEHCMNEGVKVYTAKDGYELGDNIQSKVLAFAFGLAAEIERDMISRRTTEALARKKAQGVVLGRPVGRKSSKVKLTGRDEEIIQLRIEGLSKAAAARRLGVDRNTLSAYCAERGLWPSKARPEQLKAWQDTHKSGDSFGVYNPSKGQWLSYVGQDAGGHVKYWFGDTPCKRPYKRRATAERMAEQLGAGWEVRRIEKSKEAKWDD